MLQCSGDVIAPTLGRGLRAPADRGSRWCSSTPRGTAPTSARRRRPCPPSPRSSRRPAESAVAPDGDGRRDPPTPGSRKPRCCRTAPRTSTSTHPADTSLLPGRGHRPGEPDVPRPGPGTAGTRSWDAGSSSCSAPAAGSTTRRISPPCCRCRGRSARSRRRSCAATLAGCRCSSTPTCRPTRPAGRFRPHHRLRRLGPQAVRDGAARGEAPGRAGRGLGERDRAGGGRPGRCVGGSGGERRRGPGGHVGVRCGVERLWPPTSRTTTTTW